MKKKSIWILAIGLVIVIAGVMVYRMLANNRAAASTSLQTATVTRGELSTTLSSSGTASAAQSAVVSWQVSGQVADVEVVVGDLVQEDALVLSLDTDVVTTSLVEAREDLINAQNSLEDLQNTTLQQAEALETFESAQTALNTLIQTSAEEKSQAQLALADAQEALEDAEKTRLYMNYPHTTDKLVLEKAETDYLLAKEAYKEAMKEYNEYKHKNLTNPQRAQALTRLLAAEQTMQSKLAIWTWYTSEPTALEIAQADAALEVARANLMKAEADWELVKDGTSSTTISLAQATLAEAQTNYADLKDGPSEEEIALAEAQVENAQSVLDSIRLVAPFGGTVTELYAQGGDQVTQGDKAFRIDDLSTIKLTLSISEVDLAGLEAGQKAIVEFDALTDQQFEGTVIEIGMVATSAQGVVNFPVVVEVKNVENQILPGMTAYVTITTEQVQDRLLVPNKALATINGQRVVVVLFEGQEINVPVTVGLVGDSYTEVMSDQLREGDVVVLKGSTTSSSSSSNTSQQNQMPGGGFMMEIPAGGGPGGMP